MIGLTLYSFIQSFSREPYPEDFLEIANVYSGNNDYEKLIKISMERISSHPDDVNGYWYLGLAYQRTAQFEKAIFQYKTAISKTKSESHLKTLNKNLEQCKQSLKKQKAKALHSGNKSN